MRRDLENLLNPDAINRALRSMPVREPQPELRTSLRVMASRERQRRLATSGVTAVVRMWRDRFEMFSENFWRAIFWPAAGGVASAVVLFSMCVVPAYPLRAHTTADVPTVLTTQVAVKGMAPFFGGGDDVVVDVTVDEQGRMIDYAVVAGASALANASLRRRLENVLLFTEFTPATSFGQPMPSKTRLWFRTSRIDVKG
ncbi:MAG TPA: hypothetical protein VK687_11270 [Bryobacteraceae bacterium]|nr:hypothetical protein [Bryobacteraceae bacterium]